MKILIGSFVWVNLDGLHVAGVVLEFINPDVVLIYRFDDGEVIPEPELIPLLKLRAAKWGDFQSTITTPLTEKFKAFELKKWEYV